MVRVMQPGELPALKALWVETFGDTPEFAERVFAKFAGEANVYVAEKNGEPVGMLSAVPVTLGERHGAYFYGLAVRKGCRGRGIAAALMEHVCGLLGQRGAAFAVLIPAEESLFGYYEAHGFQRAFPLRRLKRPVRRNIWSQAEFDSATAKKLCELRKLYCPEAVVLSPNAMTVVLTELYSAGATVVSNDSGYGIYFRKGETLIFPELLAEGDRAAEVLMEAAREKEVVVENAEITVGALQNLFQGEGKTESRGMIRFLAEPFDVSESYLRLMLDD